MVEVDQVGIALMSLELEPTHAGRIRDKLSP